MLTRINNIKFKILWFFLVLTSFLFAQGYDTSGDEEFIKNTPKKFQTKGLVKAVVPDSYDLIKYMPPIGDQERSGSCIAWTLSYYSMSILYNRHFDVVDRTAKFALAFDPYYVYNSRLGENYSKEQLCKKGMGWDFAFRHIERRGNKRMAIPPYDLNCQNRNEESNLYNREEFNEAIENSRSYRIRKKQRLDPDDDDYIYFIKQEIFLERSPVPIGISYYGEGLAKAGKNGGYFQPNYVPKIEEERKGHAMTIVGYDDYVMGGSVLVANSWGTKWGNNGFLWISYEDLRTYTHITLTVEPRFYGKSIREKTNYKYGEGEFGRYEYSNGDFYEGEFVDIELSDGKRIIRRDGYGVYYYKSSDSYYVGKWDYDSWSAKSTKEGKHVTFKNNRMTELVFENNKVIRREPSWTLGLVGTKEKEESSVKNFYETKFKGSGFVWQDDN